MVSVNLRPFFVMFGYLKRFSDEVSVEKSSGD